MNEQVLLELAKDRQREMREAVSLDRGLRRSSQERAAELRSLEHELERMRVALGLRWAE